MKTFEEQKMNLHRKKERLSVTDPRRVQLFNNLISTVHRSPTALQTFNIRIVNKPGCVDREIILDDSFDNDDYDDDRRGQFLSHAL